MKFTAVNDKKYYLAHRTVIMLAVFFLLTPTVYSQDLQLNGLSRSIALKGTIVTPSEVIKDGWVLIENGKISGIYPSNTRFQFPAKTTIVDTRGLIFPGFVDVHNHISFNIFPYWSPGRQKFNNRYKWRFHLPEYQDKVAGPYENLQPNIYCQMNMYGEIRAIIGGTTSVVNAGPDCIKGYTRDLGDSDQVDNRRIETLIDIQNHKPNTSNASVDGKVNAMKDKLAAGELDAFFIHLAEGKKTDLVTKQEFSILQQKGLLTGKTAIIHGISLNSLEFDAMYNAGASLVWSPKSNIALYGHTADIKLAKTKKIRIALAPDWAITGSSNMMEELQYAARWNKQHLDNLLTYKDLVDMATSIPASIAGLSDKVGSIKKGLFADLLIISGDPADPYRSLVQASPHDIKLVLVNGSPVYGAKVIMEKFWPAETLEVLLNTKMPLVIKHPYNSNTNDNIKKLASVLRIAMEAQGVKLAPLFPIPNK